MMDAYELAISQDVYGKSDGFKGTPTSSFPLFIDKGLRTITHWKTKDNFFKFILPVRPYYSDKRIMLQKSCFTFHVPERDILKKEHNKTLQKYLIPKEKKSAIKSQLSLLGINDFTTYGDMESLSSTLRTNYNIK